MEGPGKKDALIAVCFNKTREKLARADSHINLISIELGPKSPSTKIEFYGNLSYDKTIS